jgi:hypothetical protein
LPVPIGVGVAQVVDDPVYVSGWTISGLAVLMAIVTGLILGIQPPEISIL